MNNKKGFTLTEILVVIVLIGLISLIGIPSVIKVRNGINKRTLETKNEMIIKAAKLYAKDKNIKETTTIYVYDLLESNYISSDTKDSSICTGEHTSKGCVINPVDNSNYNNTQITITIDGNKTSARIN